MDTMTDTSNSAQTDPTPPPKAAADQLQDFFRRGGANVVGAFLFWSLSSVRVPRSYLRERMEQIGLGKAVARDPRPERILSRAVERAKVGLGNSGRVFFRRLGKYQWAILEERGQQIDRLDPVHVLTVRATSRADVQRGHNPFVVHPADPQEAVGRQATMLANRVLELCDEVATTAGTEDLSAAITTALHGTYTDPMLCAVSLRERTGGLYFVPPASVEQAKELATVVGGCGNSHMRVLTMYADQENLEAASQAAATGLRSRLNELREEVGDFVADMRANDKEATDRNLDTRLRRYKSLQERVEVYAEILGGAREEILGEIEAAKTELRKELAC